MLTDVKIFNFSRVCLKRLLFQTYLGLLANEYCCIIIFFCFDTQYTVILQNKVRFIKTVTTLTLSLWLLYDVFGRSIFHIANCLCQDLENEVYILGAYTISLNSLYWIYVVRYVLKLWRAWAKWRYQKKKKNWFPLMGILNQN